MGYLLLAASAVFSVVAFRLWWKVLRRWQSQRQIRGDLADVVVGDWPGLIGLLLPPKPRRVWNFLVLWAITLLLGLPHHLVIWNYFVPKYLTPMHPWHYAWTLVYWLVLLGLPASVLVRHQITLEQTAADLSAPE